MRRGCAPRRVSGAIVAATLLASSGAVCAAEPQPRPVKAKITTLGTAGGPAIRPGRSEPATLLIVDGRYYLIDCGAGALHQLAKAGVNTTQLDAIFITHHHPDHDLDLANIMADRLFNKVFRKGGGILKIYGPAGTQDMVQKALAYLQIPFTSFAAEGMGAADPAAEFSAHDIPGDGAFYEDDIVTATAAENTHYSLIPSVKLGDQKALSYRFATPAGTIVFTGDTGPSANLERLAKDTDILVSEVVDDDLPEGLRRGTATRSSIELQLQIAHMTKEHLLASEVGKLAAKANARAVILTHILPVLADGPAAERIAGQVKQIYAGPVYPASDLQGFCFAKGAGSERAAPVAC